jgi:hypothetical protein
LRYNHFVTDNRSIELLRLLADRLERLSADSHWAHRASGLRGSITKLLEQTDAGVPVAARRLNLQTKAAFEILREAAQEIPDLENMYKNNELLS